MLSYRRSGGDTPGFHQIKVDVVGQALKVRSRPGYYLLGVGIDRLSWHVLSETGNRVQVTLPGRAVARTGLRMMPTVSTAPLKSRTAGFPQYGFKAEVSGGALPVDCEFSLFSSQGDNSLEALPQPFEDFSVVYPVSHSDQSFC